MFKAWAASVVLTGDIGAGNVTKLANQIIVAINIAAVSEALVLATKAGVDPKLVYQAIEGGLAGSTVLNAKAPLMMDRKFNPGFRINLHIKDLGNALDTGHRWACRCRSRPPSWKSCRPSRSTAWATPTTAPSCASTRSWPRWK